MRLANVLAASAVLLTAACVNLEGVAIGTGGAPSKYPMSTFVCDNGYKLHVSYRGKDGAVMGMNTGKKQFVIMANEKPAASGVLYANDLGTVKWHEKNNSGILTYPDEDYVNTKKLRDTACKKL
ncbi:MAG: MliC family protein [Neisseria sp.]|nr:MliC family protein [Neisseria sp.]